MKFLALFLCVFFSLLGSSDAQESQSFDLAQSFKDFVHSFDKYTNILKSRIDDLLEPMTQKIGEWKTNACARLNDARPLSPEYENDPIISGLYSISIQARLMIYRTFC